MKIVNSIFITTHLSKINTFVFASLVLIFGSISIYLGKDINWDLRNYHFYDSYSFLTGRMKYDYLPAQIQTFHNPFLYLFIYKIITIFPPKVAGFCLGGLQGINCFIVFLISQKVLLNQYSARLNLFLSLLIAVIGACAPMFVSEIGTTFGDNLTSLLVLIGFLLIISDRKYKYLLAGLFIGLAIGFKLTNLVYGLSTVITILFLEQTLYRKISTNISVIVGIIIGTICTSGYWMLRMLEAYSNPLFPYYNAIFKSPYFSLINFRDNRFVPKDIFHAISYPFLWAFNKHPSLELPFQDLRWLIVCLLSIILVLVLIFKQHSLINLNRHVNNSIEIHSATSIEASKYIILITIFSFVIWLFQFGYHRYLLPLELISGLSIFCLLEQITQAKTIRIYGFILLSMLILTTTESPSWGRSDWHESWFEVSVPKIEFPKNTLVLMGSGEPTSYVIPFFPSYVRFIRIEGNFVEFIKATSLEKEITEIIQRNQGSFFILLPKKSNKKYIATLNSYNLETAMESCTIVNSQFEQLKLCSVKRHENI
jgi:Glycosyltransferase family 87